MFLAMAGMSLAACAGGPRPSTSTGVASSRTPLHGTEKPYQVNGVWYYPKSQPNYDEIGMASWYGQRGHNPYTADGEVFDDRLPSGAHKTLPLPSLVEVTNLANGRTLVVRLNDRGPFVSGRVIDLSREAAAELDFLTAGVTLRSLQLPARSAATDGLARCRQFVGRHRDAPGWSGRPVIVAA
jgi:rare lipoprotein A